MLNKQGDNIQPWCTPFPTWNHSVVPCSFLLLLDLHADFSGAGKVVRYSHLFKNFLQFVMIHTVKGFGIVNKAEVDVFLEFSYFFSDPVELGIWPLVSLLFLNTAWTSGSSWFTYYWSLAWRILSITFQACEMRAIVWQFERSLALPFFEIAMTSDVFQSCGHWWVFHNCWHIECNTFTASSFRIWNSSAVIPSLPLAVGSDAS